MGGATGCPGMKIVYFTLPKYKRRKLFESGRRKWMLVTNVLGRGLKAGALENVWLLTYSAQSRCKMVPCLTKFEVISSYPMPYFCSVSSKVGAGGKRVFPPHHRECGGDRPLYPLSYAYSKVATLFICQTWSHPSLFIERSSTRGCIRLYLTNPIQFFYYQL